MRSPEATAPLFYQELDKIMRQDLPATAERAEALYQLLHRLFFEATRHERLPFTTHFARMAYAGHQFGLSRRLLYFVHRFRRAARGDRAGEEITYQLGCKAVAEVIMGLYRQNPPAELAERLPLDWPLPETDIKVAAFRPKVRVLALADEPEHEQLLARDADRPDRPVRVQYNMPERNELFTPTVELLRKVTGFPVTLHLLDVEIDTAGIYHPRAMVLEPDFLADVSAVAECFHGTGTHPWGYLLKRFLPFEQSAPLLLGHIANFFLDELMARPDVTFKELKRHIFSLNPLAFCLFTDRQVLELIQKSQAHFLCLKQLVNGGLKQEGIDPADGYLEPSFYSEHYGLQGRLDLLYRPATSGERTAIVELKSGQPFMANIHGISPNHFIQTLLYDLLIRSAFGHDANIGAYILYSGMPERPLRFAPAVRANQYEALQLRNQLVAIEYLLSQLGPGDETLTAQADRLFGKLRPGRFPELKGFARRDLAHFSSVYEQLEPLERAYFGAFAGFIAREQLLAKKGMQGEDNVNGLASLWLDDPADKEIQYQRLAGLRVSDNDTGAAEPLLTLQRTENTNPLANFRVGDIAVLFPETEDGRGMLRHQVYKCTIVELDAQHVRLRLRSRQSNPAIFDAEQGWNLEHDLLDSSFLAYYRGLFTFAQSPPARRRLLLGRRAPARPEALPAFTHPDGLTGEQQGILRQMLAAPEYFLLWGPPGTGKTSVMLHHLVGHLLEHTDENLLLLAYTNRAVDEICESIERLGEHIRGQYLRIGSRYGTGENYQEQLLQRRIEGLQSRKELKELLAGRRIFVGTVASLAGKTELFQLKSFQRVIIDEASQILEPLLLGLLPHFPRWILIGDHRQLPAVVTQRPEDTRVRDPGLQALGLDDLGQSLFERLYRRAQEQGWSWAYAQLRHQGRMHEEIMAFPALHFYQGRLACLPPETKRHARQTAPLELEPPTDGSALASVLARQRLLFVPTPVDEQSTTLKTNRPEAERLAELVRELEALYAHNQRPLRPGSIGIITPYRAQIAQIRATLYAAGVDPSHYTIDTVERYQGGARDIILISLCTNSPRQLLTLSSLSAEGVDRKLNVAMTRAREHLIILGNAELLRGHEVYGRLLAHCEVSVH